MRTAVDTNVLVDLLAGDERRARAAVAGLDAACEQGAVVVCPVVYAELLAYPGRIAQEVDDLLNTTDVHVGWDLPSSVWADAVEAFAAYGDRRRAGGADLPCRILPDVVIGAHAQRVGRLLTRDLGLYRTAFPDLRVLGPRDDWI